MDGRSSRFIVWLGDWQVRRGSERRVGLPRGGEGCGALRDDDGVVVDELCEHGSGDLLDEIVERGDADGFW